MDDTSKTLVIVEDDLTFARTLARSFERRGYRVATAHGSAELASLLEVERPDFAVVDLKLGTESGLGCVRLLKERHPDTRIVVLTGYASIATAVEAIKLGAIHDANITLGNCQTSWRPRLFPAVSFGHLASAERLARRRARFDRPREGQGTNPRGEVAEWSNAPHSKCGVRATVPWVRIPPSPPITNSLYFPDCL